ncbi:unnamed protein product, partial [Lymnaea stagnalis]
QYPIIIGACSVAITSAALLAVVSCSVSARTFIAMGLDDALTVSFLVLSLSDLCYVASLLSSGVFSVLWAVEMISNYAVRFGVDPYGAYILTSNVGFLIYPMTMLTTTFLAVARCMCVARPLRFGDLFSTRRCATALAAFVVLTVASYVPVLSNLGVGEAFDPRVNLTRLLVWSSGDRQFVRDVVLGTRDTFLSITSQIIVTACVFVLSFYLRRAQSFRRSSSLAIQRDGTPSSSEAFDGRELRVVQQVTVISSVYVLCNFPKVLVNISGILEPDLKFTKRFQKVYQLIIIIMNLFQVLNCGINITIYYRYNTKFRRFFGGYSQYIIR